MRNTQEATEECEQLILLRETGIPFSICFAWPSCSDDVDEESEDDAEEGRKLVICVRNDLGMSVGKVAAQVGHAVHAALMDSKWKDLRAWEATGSKKVTLRVDSEEQLNELKKQARDLGLVARSIQDAGHTEVEAGTTTVLAVGPGCDKAVNEVTGKLRPLPDRVESLERENKKLRDRAERLQRELDAAKRNTKQVLQLMRGARRCV